MRAFVTGATGFIGQHLVEALVDRGDHVIAMVRNPHKADVLPSGVETFAGDLDAFSDESLRLPEHDVVIHLAGVVTADRLAEYERINFTAVDHLLRCLARQRFTPKRFLFASSLAAAGPSPAERPWTESDELSPIDPYGRAKGMAEALVNRAPFPTTSFRPCIVLGPRDAATLTLFEAAQRGWGIRVAGDPQRLSFVDVRDVVRATLLMADDSRDGHFTYFVSHPNAMDLSELWSGLGRALDRRVKVVPIPKPALYVAMRCAETVARVAPIRNQLDEKQYRQMTAPAFVCSSEALSRDLGWRAEHDLGAALAHAVAGYRDAGML